MSSTDGSNEAETFLSNGVHYGLYLDTTDYILEIAMKKYMQDYPDMMNNSLPDELLDHKIGSYLYVVPSELVGLQNLSNTSHHMLNHWWPGVSTTDVVENATKYRGPHLGMRICKGTLKGSPHMRRQVSWLMKDCITPGDQVFYQYIIDFSGPIPDSKKFESSSSVSSSSFTAFPPMPQQQMLEPPSSSSPPIPVALECPVHLKDYTTTIYEEVQKFSMDYTKALRGAANMAFTQQERDYYKMKAEECDRKIKENLNILTELSHAMVETVNKPDPIPLPSMPEPTRSHRTNRKSSN